MSSKKNDSSNNSNKKIVATGTSVNGSDFTVKITPMNIRRGGVK